VQDNHRFKDVISYNIAVIIRSAEQELSRRIEKFFTEAFVGQSGLDVFFHAKYSTGGFNVLEPLLRGTRHPTYLAPSPIEPNWIESENPRARFCILASTDDRLATTVLWECTAGRFTWRYDMDETIYILEGGVTLNQPGVPEMRLGPGDCAHFSRGAAVTWIIDSKVRKVAFCKDATPRAVSSGIRILRALLRRMKGSSRAFGAPESAEAARS